MSGRSVLVGGDDDIAVLPAPTFKQTEQRQQGTCWTTKKQPAGCFFVVIVRIIRQVNIGY